MAAGAAAAAAAVAEVDRRMQHLSSFYSSDSEGTLGTFAVHFGRRFGTKLGGVLVQKRLRVSGRRRWEGLWKLASSSSSSSSSGWSRRMQHFPFFSRDSEVTLGIFAVHFGRRSARN